MFARIMAVVLLLFGFSVTMKYANDDVLLSEGQRDNYLLAKRPYMPLIDFCNHHFPDARIFESYLDEYRAWCAFEVIGHRDWDDSWEVYCEKYPDNTALNLWRWITSLDCQYIMVNEQGEFKLPRDDPEFPLYFQRVVTWQGISLYHVYRFGDNNDIREYEIIIVDESDYTPDEALGE